MPRVVIRRARPEDGPVVRDIVFDTLRSYGIEPDPEGLDADVVSFGQPQRGATREWVAELGQSVVGSVVIGPYRRGEAWLSKLFVAPAHRGKGIGKRLMEHAITDAKARKYRRLWLETRTIYREAVQLYESTGWIRGPDPPPERGPDRSYWLPLEPLA
jgi:putative acetyltransferase